MTLPTDNSGFELLADPAPLTATEREVQQVALNIRSWQDRTIPKMSDEAIVRHYPGLGSTKTYRAIRSGIFTSLIAENQLPKYQSVWALVCTAGSTSGREEIYEDLTPTLECCEVAAGLIPQQGRERLVIIEGPSGSGKTTALEVIDSKYPGQCVRVEAKETWASIGCMLEDLLIALDVHKAGDEKMPVSKGGRLAAIQANLNKSRRIILVDEGHHLSAAGLNLIKSILNASNSLMMLACIDTLWRKLAAKNWEEAKQLVHNRMFERVRLAPPSTEDIELLLTRRIPALAMVNLTPALGKVAIAAQHYGHFAFMRRLCDRLSRTTTALTAGDVIAASDALSATLRTR